jgi:hypothetical protein
MNIKKYLSDAQNRAHESFANADGFFDDDLSFTAGEDFSVLMALPLWVLLLLQHHSLTF